MQKIEMLNDGQLLEVDGGIDPVAVAGLILAVIAFGYSVGKDMAEADRRNGK